jgi:hypothetical protein
VVRAALAEEKSAALTSLGEARTIV